jgi:HSP20 family protein
MALIQSLSTDTPDVSSLVSGFLGESDHELHEEDDEFVLAINLPGFQRDNIDVAWDDGVLNIAAEQEDPDRGRRRAYRRQFRFPRRVDPDGIEATYRNGVLEVRLPIAETGTRGQSIEVTAA